MAQRTVDIRLGTKYNGSGIAALKKGLASVGRNLVNIQAGFSMLSGVATQAFGLVRTALQKAFDAEYALTNFRTMLGSIDEAKRHVAELKRFAAQTPLTFGDLSQASKTLLAFGANVNDIMPALKNLGDISLGNSERFQSLALAFGKVQSEGKLTGVTLKQMVIAGFNPLQEISAKTGATIDELKSQMEKGAISFDLVAAAMNSATGEGGRFHDAMLAASKTGTGLVSTLQDNWTAAVAKFGGAFADAAKGGLALAIEKLQQLNKDGTIDVWADKVAAACAKAVSAVKEAVGWGSKLLDAYGWVRDKGEQIGSAVGTAVGYFMGGGYDYGEAMDLAKNAYKESGKEIEERNAEAVEHENKVRAEAAKKAAREEAETKEKSAKKGATIEELYQKQLAEKQAEEDKAAAEKKAKEEIKAAEKAAKERERLDEQAHQKRMAFLRSEVKEQQKREGKLNTVVSAAQSEFDRAFAMYRDPEHAAAQIAEERDYAADLERLHKDARRYGGKWRIDELSQLMSAGDTQGVAESLERWRKSKGFTPQVEAMVRASAAEQTKTTAEDELRRLNDKTERLSQTLEQMSSERNGKLDEIEKNTNQLANKLDELLTVKG